MQFHTKILRSPESGLWTSGGVDQARPVARAQSASPNEGQRMALAIN
eukprot:COSAG02_NODE_27385_length_611_cov_0.685547_1_plen_46_part_10